MRLDEELNKRGKELNDIVTELEKTVRDLPEGKLRISGSRGYKRFYKVTADGGKNGKYIGAEKTDLVKSLAQKDYDLRVINRIKKELDCLKKYESVLTSGTFENLYDSLSEGRKSLVRPIVPTDEEFVKNWLSRDYKKMGFKEGEPYYETSGGKKVRSKSEALILNALDAAGVPNLYEVPLSLNGSKPVRPDFMVLNVRTRKEFIWEHFGMLDDPFYLERALRKIEAYIANGYIPGINLIITFESDKHPLDLKTVETLIETHLK